MTQGNCNEMLSTFKDKGLSSISTSNTPLSNLINDLGFPVVIFVEKANYDYIIIAKDSDQ